MNIFVTSPNPQECARALDDRRLVKMVLETAQILSTAMRVSFPHVKADDFYRETHKNHPCVVWAGVLPNALWLADHGRCLAYEYTHRFGKEHKSYQVIKRIHHALLYQGPCSLQPTPFVNCTDFKQIEDVHEAYKQALRTKWENDGKAARWTNREQPSWR